MSVSIALPRSTQHLLKIISTTLFALMHCYRAGMFKPERPPRQQANACGLRRFLQLLRMSLLHTALSLWTHVHVHAPVCMCIPRSSMVLVYMYVSCRASWDLPRGRPRTAHHLQCTAATMAFMFSSLRARKTAYSQLSINHDSASDDFTFACTERKAINLPPPEVMLLQPQVHLSSIAASQRQNG